MKIKKTKGGSISFYAQNSKDSSFLLSMLERMAGKESDGNRLSLKKAKRLAEENGEVWERPLNDDIY